MLFRRKSQRPRRPWRERLAQRSTDLCLFLTGIALAVACGALEALGPRPALAINALWVNDNRPKVEVMLAALVLAAMLSVPGLMIRRTRSFIVFMWIGASVLLAVRYWERFIIVIDVVRAHAL